MVNEKKIVNKILGINQPAPTDGVDTFYLPNYSGVQQAALKTATPLGGGITIKDEGVNLTTAPSSIDFVGAGVTGTNIGNDVTVTIPGATPGGILNSVQFNNPDGTLSGASTLVYSGANVGIGEFNPTALLHISGANPQLIVYSGAQRVFAVSGAQTYISGGSSSIPGLAFWLDSDTGIYRSAANTLGITAGGLAIATFAANTLTVTANTDVVSGNTSAFLLEGGGVGSATAPTYAFVGDTNTGIYRSAVDRLEFTSAGTRMLFISGGSAGGLFGSGAFGLQASTAPTLNGTVASGAMFISGGELWYLGYSGTQTRVAVA